MKTPLIVISLLGLFLSGCSSNNKPSYSFDIQTRRITIVTEPAGATVMQINPAGQGRSNLGKTPMTDRSVVVVTKITKMKNMSYRSTKQLFEQVNNVVVQIEREGYETYFGSLKTDADETAVHTITLTPIEVKDNEKDEK